MRAVVCTEFGTPDHLEVRELDDPVPGPDEVLVDVRAAAVTYPDTLIIRNLYQFKAEPPFIPGGEVAGVVAAVGDRVEGFSVGDDVVGGVGTVGGFAERQAVPSARLRPLPSGLGYAESTGLGYAYGTGWYGLRYRGDIEEGETVLVLGAAGAVGLAAIELAKVVGARVIAAASTEEKLALCRERGADETINYSEEDLKVRAKELAGENGVDIVYDAVGGERAEQALRTLGWRGRFLVIGFTAGIPKIPLNLTLLKSCDIRGVFWGASQWKEPEVFQRVAKEIDEMAARGDLRPQVTRRYALEDAGQALDDMMNRRIVGKVVVEP